MECEQCGEANREGARFCSGCGTALARRCAHCQAELRPTAKFCDECGTSFGERTDAEVARSVMARYHALLQDAIGAHGGTVAKFMGDGMMATFGIPEIAEDLDAATAELDRRQAALEAESGR